MISKNRITELAYRTCSRFFVGDKFSIDRYEFDAVTLEVFLKEIQKAQWLPIEKALSGQLALFYDANATEVRKSMFVDWMVDGEFCGNRHHVATHCAPLPAYPQP